jgi:DNA-binding response OmpR family regulator
MSNSDSEKKSILLVEDQEDAWEIVAFNLPEYKIICARDVDEGLRFARQMSFDLYILDNWLPDGSGIGLCRLIREFDPHTPILFYSAAAYERDRQEALRAGAQGYLVKPVSFGEFKQAVTQLTSAVGKRESVTRLAAITAIREELAIRQMDDAEWIKQVQEKRLRSEEKALRLKAEIAFLAAMGTRGDFARLWPSVYIREVRNRHGDDRGSGATSRA